MINFVKLCESCLIEEADLANLKNIARQARQWKRSHTDAVKKLIEATRNRSQQDIEKANKQKRLAVQQLVVLQDFLKDEYLDENGNRLPDEEFTDQVKKSSFYTFVQGNLKDGADDTGGLVFLTTPYIKKLKSM